MGKMLPLLVVENIFRYPVKSFAGENIASSKVTFSGLEYYRCWMLMDSKDQLMTQRKTPKMSQTKAYIEKNNLYVKLPKRAECIIKQMQGQDEETVQIWNDEVSVLSAGNAANEALSDLLNTKCRLMAINPAQPRNISDPAAEGVVSLADGFPFLLIGTASLTGLNKRLQKAVSMSNFRPNMVVQTDVEHEEDLWDEVEIGDVRFKNAKLCGRCVMTTVNPVTSEKSKDMQPLKTLLSYRKNHKGVAEFGINLIALNEGQINQGDVLKIISYKKNALKETSG